MISKKNIPRFFSIFLLLLLSLLPIFWYRSDSIIGGGDSSLPLNYDVYFKKSILSWNETLNTGKNMVIRTSKLPEYCLLKLISFSGLPPNQLQIIYFSFIILGTTFSMYFFVYQLLDDENQILKIIAPLIGAVVYFFNFFSMTRWENFDRPIFSIGIALPFIFGLTLRSLKKDSHFNYFFFALSGVLLSGAVDNPPSLLAGIFAIIIFFIYLLLQSFSKKSLYSTKRVITVGLKVAVILILSNLFWFIPMISSGGPKALFEEYAPFDWLSGMSQTTSFLNVFRLMGAWYWYDNIGGIPSAPYAQIYLNNSLFIFFTWAFPSICLVGLLFSLKVKKARFLIPFLLFSIFFSMGDHPPLGKIYRFLYDNIIFVKPFRSPWFKFSLIIVLCYSFYYGYLSGKIIEIFYRFSKTLSVFFFLILFSFPIVLSYPMIKATFYDKWRIKIPDYVYNSIRFLDTNLNEGERVFVYTYGQNSNFSWGYSSQSPLLFFLIYRPIVGPFLSIFPNEYSNILYKPVNAIIEAGSKKEIANYLSFLGVKYLVLMKDIIFLDEKVFKFVDKQFNEKKNINLIKNYSKWDIYENSNPLPLFVYKEKLISLIDQDYFLTLLESLPPDNIYCIDCGSKPKVIRQIRVFPGDFIKENNTGYYDVEISDNGEYQITLKAVNNFSGQPKIYLDGRLLYFVKSGEGQLTANVSFSVGKHRIRLDESLLPGTNYLQNGNFSGNLFPWESFQEGTFFSSPVKSSLEKYGSGKVKLQSIGKTMVLSQKISRLESGQYRLRFGLKSLEKLPLQVGISNQQKNPTGFTINPNYNKFFSPIKIFREIIFSPPKSEFYINFYAEVNSAIPNRHVLSDISLTKSGELNYIDVSPKITEYKNLTFTKVSQTKYILNFDIGKPGWLNFNMTCSPDWIAIDKSDRNLKLEQLCTNIFANGYFLPRQGHYQVEIYYVPQMISEYSSYYLYTFLLILFIKTITDIGRMKILQ